MPGVSAKPAISEEYKKYFKLKKMGMGVEQLKQKMTNDGMDPSIIDLPEPDWSASSQPPTTSAEPPQSSPNPVARAPAKPAISEEYKKYFKLKKMGMGVEQLKQKMTNDGMDPSIIDLPEPDWNASSSSEPVSAPTPNTPTISEEYKKYFKLKKMGMGVEQLKQKMTNDGMDPSIIDLPEPDWNASSQTTAPTQRPTPPSEPVTPAKPAISEEYKKYFKLKKMGMGVEQLKQKMMNDGMDPSVIDLPEPDWKANTQPPTTASEQPEPTPSEQQPEPEPEPEPDPYTPPTREKYNPSTPLRQVYWSVVSGRDLKDTIWETMESPRINSRELEELFEVKKQATTGTFTPAAQVVEEQFSFVDPKKETNIGIGLRKLRYSSDEVKQFLFNIDKYSLCTEALNVMSEIVPKEEECETIRAYQGAVEKLNPVNAFLYSVAAIPNCQERVNCLLLRANFPEERERIAVNLKNFQSDCDQVLTNPHFTFLLSYVLEVGNYLNGSSSRGGACGFHLEILPQLERTKTTNNSVSFVELCQAR